MTRAQSLSALSLACLGLALWVGQVANANREIARRTHAVRAHSRDLDVLRASLEHHVRREHERLTDELRAELAAGPEEGEGQEELQ
ncbi:MAG: hypothetical protein ACYS26_04310 [Planctomycetota bacterium]|jgi:hypothetical protein